MANNRPVARNGALPAGQSLGHAYEADDLAQEFRDYAYIVSHDLGTPVRLMVEFARLLAERQSAFADEEDRVLLGEIMGNGEKLRAMMQGLLSYSRLNTLAAPHIPVDTQKIAEHCRMVMLDKLRPVRGKLTISGLPSLKADPDQLMQLFNLLVDNAIKFVTPGVPPEISITAKGDGGLWLFSVRDNGIGIEEMYRNRIFKPFQKLHLDDEYPGVGMGLSLARKIVNLHGGRIWIQESSATGTLLQFTLCEGERVDNEEEEVLDEKVD
ncbi:MAG TPA: ATP-binding protein [Asticcacaulis sp.]|nr:ATP-binding protein [Asticcacaulis sp.]